MAATRYGAEPGEAAPLTVADDRQARSSGLASFHGVARLQLTGRILVIQPRPGVGDLIWHLPLIRAIAAAGSAGRVTLMAKPSTQADVLLAGDPAVEGVVWLHRNKRTGRGAHDGLLGHLRLIQQMRACHAESCVVLHHAKSLAASAAAAGIATRHGYGFGAQRVWLTAGPRLGAEVRTAHAFEQANAFARAAGLWPLAEPAVTPTGAARRWAAREMARLARPVAALGIGSDEAARRWHPRRFASLARRLLHEGYGTVLVLAAASEAALAHEVAGSGADPRLHAVAGQALDRVAALLSLADLFVGNDSGLLNLRAAVGRRAYGLFGASGPLRHSRHIRPVVPPGGPRAGMDRIELPHVLRALAEDGAVPTAAVLPRPTSIDRIVLAEETPVG